MMIMRQEPILPINSLLNLEISKSLMRISNSSKSWWIVWGIVFAFIINIIFFIILDPYRYTKKDEAVTLFPVELQIESEIKELTNEDSEPLEDPLSTSITLPEIVTSPTSLPVVTSRPVLSPSRTITPTQRQAVTPSTSLSHKGSVAPTIIKPAPVAQNQPAIKTLSVAERCLLPNLAVYYPMAAKRRHEQGSVIISLQVMGDGSIQNLTVLKSSGFSDLDKAALDAVKTIHCKAEHSQPIVKTQIPVDFVMH